ncbi:MAG: SMC-Scp complex subunit ScpB [Vampirovibrionales bacterium]
MAVINPSSTVAPAETPELELALEPSETTNYLDHPKHVPLPAPHGKPKEPAMVRYQAWTPEALQARVEALLFMTNRPLGIEELVEALHAPLDALELALSTLKACYQSRGEASGLEVVHLSEGWILQVRPVHQDLIEDFIPVSLSQGAMRTLSVLALKAPILLSELVQLRGSGVYDHLPELLSKQLIQKQKKGRSSLLMLTKRFHELFQLQGDKKRLDVLLKRHQLEKSIEHAMAPSSVPAMASS